MSIRAKKLYKPLNIHNKTQYTLDRAIIYQYGLIKKSDIRRIEYLVERYRTIAKKYTNSSNIYKGSIKKLMKKGIIDSEDFNLLSLTTSYFLERRLATLVKKKYNKTILQSRKLIVDGHIRINDKVIKRPSSLINLIDTITMTGGG